MSAARHLRPLLLVLLAAGCAVGPDYQRPSVESPAGWRIEYPQAADVANTAWWQQFDDPALNQLIETALRENRDLVIAAARVDQFLGRLQTTRSQFYPQVNYSVDASRNRASAVGVPPLAPGADPYYSLYQGALGADWQIDLFGRVRRQSESAQAQLYASEQGRRGVVLSVVTTVAASYINLRALDRQLEIARATGKNYAETARIFELRHKGGVVSKLELAQVDSQYQQALAAIPALEQEVAAQENLLSVLLGRNPGGIARGKPLDAFVAPAIPADLPSSLLERRPDILQAEQNLIATNADIGAAKAQYFPQLSLTGAFGSISAVFGDFLSGPAAAWSAAASISGPIFNAGAIAGQVESAEAAEREALASYQQTVLNAFRETNDALVGTQKRQEEATAQANRVTALREYARLSRLRFDNGYAGYVDVLFAENELFSAELTAVRSQADRYTELVNVYKAVGGGWIDVADQMRGTSNPPLADRAAQQPLY